ncbi:MAG: (Fe-S)-binding protein, partial [Desulfuromonas sp.]
MAHLTARQSYVDLTDRLNRFPQGAPPSELLCRILGMLFSEREAELVSKLPIRPFTAEIAAKNWQVGVAEAETVLQALADRALLVDMEVDGRMEYVLPPPMA